MDIQKIVEVISGDVIALAQSVLEDERYGVNTKVGRNTLKGSNLLKDLESKVDAKGDPVITALFNHYVVYLEWTRPPKYKKKPPIHVLKDWASKNGISTDAKTLWAISVAIWRDGHAGRPIFATLDKETDEMFLNEWSEKMFNELIININKFFS